MPRYLVTQKCQDLAERGYRLREEGEIVTLPVGAKVPKWFQPLDDKPAAAPAESPAPKAPDVVADTLLGTAIPGTAGPVVNAKDPLAAARRPGRPPGARRTGGAG